MAFWKNPLASPIQSRDFKVEFGGVSAWVVKSVTMPSAEVNTGEYQVGNHVFKYPGVHKWNDVTIVVVDDKNTTKQLLKKFNEQGWVTPIGLKTHNGRGGEGASLEAATNAYRDETSPVERAEAIGDALDSGAGQVVMDTNPFNAATDAAGRFSSTLSSISLADLYYSVAGPYGMKKMSTQADAIRIYQFANIGAQVPIADKPPPLGALGRAMESTYNWLNKPLFGDTPPPKARPVYNDVRQVVMNQWELRGWFIKSINFGTHDYSSDELITMEVVISYDYAYTLDDDTNSFLSHKDRVAGAKYS